MMAWGPLCLFCVSGNPVQPGRAAGVEAGRLAAERASTGGGRPAGGSCSPAWRQEGTCQCRGQEESSRVTLDDRVNRECTGHINAQ